MIDGAVEEKEEGAEDTEKEEVMDAPPVRISKATNNELNQWKCWKLSIMTLSWTPL